MESKKDENEPLHRCRTFLLQKNKAFASDQRMKHSRQYIDLQPGERNNDFLRSRFRFDKRDRDKFPGWAACLFPFHGSAHCLYVCVTASPDFVGHKMYPACHGPDGILVN